MRLEVDFSALEANVRRMGAKSIDFVLGTVWDDSEVQFDKELGRAEGVKVGPHDLEITQGLLTLRGRQVILFIPDHTFNVENVLRNPGKGRKFHVAYCDTLEEMQNAGRYKRYKVTNNVSGSFPIYGKGVAKKNGTNRVEGFAALNVCKNCLFKLNYKGAAQSAAARQKATDLFSLDSFFSTYSSVFSSLPSQHIDDAAKGYSDDWKQISAAYRKDKNYTCEKCNVGLTIAKHLLHTHHKNGEKSDNTSSNLMALCADCHRSRR